MKISIWMILLTIGIVLPSCSQPLRVINRTKLYGKYSDIALDSLSAVNLELKKDGRFEYSVQTDLQKAHASGRWILRNDTLILNSSMNKYDIPISVKELKTDSVNSNISISLTNSVDGDVLEAIIRFNNDTTTECIPLFGTGCEMKRGSIKNFRVDFSNGTYSKWYKLKNKNTNLIKVTANLSDIMALFFVNEKYLYKNGRFYHIPLVKITELDRNGGMVERESFLQKQN